MGTPSAALAIQPPPNAVDQYAKLISLKSLLNQQQLQQAQLQGASMQNQEQALQLKSQKAFMSAFSKPVNWSDPNAVQGVMEDAAQNGATPQSIATFNNMLLDQRQKLATLNKDQLAMHVQQNDMLRGTLTSIIQAKDPAQKQQMWQSAVDNALQQGLVQPGSITDTYPGDAQATVLANHLALGSVLANEAAASQRASAAATSAATGAARLNAELPGIQANTTIAQQNAALGPQGVAAARATGAAQGQLSTAASLAAARAAGTVQGQMRALGDAGAPSIVPVAASGASTLPAPPIPGTVAGGTLTGRNQAVLAQIAAKNPGLAETVKALDEGRYQIPSAFALKSPYWQMVMQLVSQYDPGFDAINYQARARTRQDFTSGASAKQVNALNTAIGHLAQLSTAADALGNSGWTSYNSLKNWLSKETGNPKVTNFEAIVQPVADELTRVWRGTGGSEADIKSRLESLSSSSSPAQLHGAIQQLGELMKSKIDALQNQYEQGMGIEGVNMLTPQAQKTLNALEGKVPAAAPVTMRAPNGQTKQVPSDQVDHYRSMGATVVSQ